MAVIKMVRYSIGIIIVLIVTGSLYLNRFSILQRMGHALAVDDEIKRSDLLVLIRGSGKNFSRPFEAIRLYKDGKGKKIYIPQSLLDIQCEDLKERGGFVDCGRYRLKKILVQFGVPEVDIVIDEQPPGGGTVGEAFRVKRQVVKSGYNSFILITNWWHSKRTRMIYKEVFSDFDCKIYVSRARRDVSEPGNWWRYRYDAINVILEYVKIVLFKMRTIFTLSFTDDPEHN